MRLVLFAFFVNSCLSLSQLEKDVLDAVKQVEASALKGRPINLKTIPDNNLHMQSQRANNASIQEGERGDWLAEITKIIIAKQGLGIMKELQEINVNKLIPQKSSSKVKRQARQLSKLCPPEDFDCGSQRNREYRSITGLCNNRVNQNWGKAVTPIARYLNTANYADGFGAFRTKSVTGSLLPSAREISNRLHTEGAQPIFDRAVNHFHQQFGQFIAHDVIFTPSAAGYNGQTLDCSACDSDRMSQHCAPIKVPPGDPYFLPGTCIGLTRQLNGQGRLGFRTAIDQNTHFLDLSDVYGSETCVAASLRSFNNGELKEHRIGHITLPPQAPKDTNCQSTTPNFCFLAGDFRNSLHPGLIPLHSVYIKLHNFIARRMKKIRPEWNDERIYQEARRLNVALYQHHVYNEYLPKLLGAAAVKEFGLKPLTTGYYAGYQEALNPSVTAEFLSSFRFGHSQARKDIPRMTNAGVSLGSVLLGFNIFYADSLYEREGNSTEEMLDGMIQSPAMAIDKEFTFPIRNQMFEIREEGASGVDLVATNIMRTRDAGLFTYNTYRIVAGLPRANSFEDLLGQMDQANVNALKAVYAHVDDIDYYSGILMERPVNGALIGRTASFFLGRGFRNLKDGDRFFYESAVVGSRPLSVTELAAVRGVSLAKLMCMTTIQMERVNSDVFNVTSPRVLCSSLPNLDVTPFTQQL